LQGIVFDATDFRSLGSNPTINVACRPALKSAKAPRRSWKLQALITQSRQPSTLRTCSLNAAAPRWAARSNEMRPVNNCLMARELYFAPPQTMVELQIAEV
jgi:hypothetical protein